MPLNIESDIEGGVDRIAGKLKKMLAGFQGLKTDALDC
jgi:hypothetical protein